MKLAHAFWFFAVLLCALPAALSISCSSGQDDDSSDKVEPGDDTSADDSSDDTGDDTGEPEFKVRTDYLLIDATTPPPNPFTGDETPGLFNKIPLFRIRQDMGDAPPRPVKAVLTLVAGYTAGANQLLFIADNLVKLSHGDIEVWVQDRRVQLLEDVVGSNEAEKRGDPWIAYNYYYNGLSIRGRTFGGYMDPHGEQTGMMSEWGLQLQLDDYRKILELIPEESRKTNIFFGGHSRGVWFAQAYASCEFEDGHLGSDDLAGLVLLDGAARLNSSYTQNDYLGDMQKIRTGELPRTTLFSFFTPDLYTELEILAMASADGLGDPEDPTLGPNGFFPDRGVFKLLEPIMTRFHDINITNEAFVGLVADDNYGLMENFHGHMGRLAGGAICQDFLGEYPCENGATYYWLNWDRVQPHELMDVQGLIRNIFEGPSNNADPYYPYRLDIDLWVADNCETTGTWRDNYFHFLTSRVDAPVFAMGTKLVSDAGIFEEYRDRLPPVRGYDAPRTEVGFEILYEKDWEHIDGLQVEPENNDFFPKLLDWMNVWATGEVTIPEFGTPWSEVEDQYPPF